MTITTFQNLELWVKATRRTDEPLHWNLYSTRWGETEKRVAFNVSIDDAQESFDFLVQSLRIMNNPDGTQFRVMMYPKGKPNNPTATALVQIFEKQQQPTTAPAGASGAAIAGFPAGVGSIQEYVDEKLKMARMQWELEEMKAALAAPNTGWERVVETISGIPGIDKILQAAVVGLVTKYNPAAAPAIQAAMNGTPAATAGESDTDDDEHTDPQAVFSANIQQAAATLQTDPVTLAQKLNQMVQQSPELAKQLLQNG